MITPPEDRGNPMNPQLALRVAIVGGCALVLFAIVFFRLWFLQVLSGTSYAALAEKNIVQTIPVQAPRGEILDASGQVLVDSVSEPAVLIAPQSLPVPVYDDVTPQTPTDENVTDQPAGNHALYVQLSDLLGISTKPAPCSPIVGFGTKTFTMMPIECAIAQAVAKQVPYSNVTVATGISDDLWAYLLERQGQGLFKGVLVEQQSIRKYPLGSVGAQVFGTIGQITEAEQKDKGRFGGAGDSDVVGQTGLEWQYNQDLQGTDGSETVKVNAAGDFEGYGSGTAAKPGYNLKLSLDADLEKVGYASLAKSIAANSGTGGAFVALDPESGQVYAMGSEPTYDPSIFTKPISESTWQSLTGTDSGYPLLNRAVQSTGPDGSTFKVITATAALESSAWSVGQYFDDTGELCLTPGVSSSCLQNAGHMVGGNIDLQKAIQISDDVFFYHLGLLLNAPPGTYPNGGALQDWARKFGIGTAPGIDLPDAASGVVPTPNYLREMYALQVACEHRTGQYRHQTGPCEIADTSQWTEGDNVNTAVGQGDVEVSPLQLAVVYSALANGGTVVTPRLGEDIQTANGTVLQSITSSPVRHLNIDPTYLDTILAGLHAAAQSPGGTSYDVMGNFGKTVYAKTGTAQYNGQRDTSWYACFVPASATSKPIVVVVWVEQGGFGDVAAAPVARQLLSKWFYGHAGAFVSGSSDDQ